MADYRLQQTGDEVQNILNTATPQSDLTAETNRAQGAEQTLQGNIDAEETRAKAEEHTLQQNIDAEALTRGGADTTLQGNIDAEETRARAAEKKNADDIDAEEAARIAADAEINGKIPPAASPQNQLADKQFVNSSIATATATFRGTFNLVSDMHLSVSATRLQIAAALPNVVATADNNDYCFVQIPTADITPTEIARIERYKFDGSAWVFEYALNNSGFTAAQWSAINSGITSGLVEKLNALPTNAALNTLLSGKQDVIADLSEIRTGAGKGATAVQPADLTAEENRAKAAEKANADDIDAIEEKIPSGASSSNQLADKAFVNQSIATATATYRGSKNQVSDLSLSVSATHAQVEAALAAAITGADNNDYCFVQVPVADATPTEIARVDRYKFDGTNWAFEYSLNNSGFTDAQWNALNSGITSGLVAKLTALPTNDGLTALLAGKQDVIADLNDIRSGASAGSTAYQKPSGGIPSSDLASGVQTSLQKADDAAPQATTYNKTQVDGLVGDEETRARAAEQANAGDIDAIEGKIPSAATPQNQLADKEFVNSSIATSTANFKGSYNEVSDLQLTPSATRSEIATALAGTITGADNNDYAFVQIPTAVATPTEIARVERYKFNGSAWAFEYELNNSGFTASQWEAINSTITSALVAKLTALPSNSELSVLLLGKQDVISDLSSIRSGASAGATAVQPADLAAEETRAKAAEKANADDIDAIEGKIPAAASDQNQLADKAFVNSSIATATATYRGAYNLVSDLSLTTAATQQQVAAALALAISTADNNDYAFVQIPTSDASPTVIARVDRYKFDGTDWAFEYSLNNSGFTAAQWDALNSGITSGLVTKLIALPTNAELETLLLGKQAVIADLADIRSGAASGATAYQKPSTGIPDTDLTLALQQQIASFITKAVNDLTYYYLKTDTYSKNEVDQLIAAINQFELVSVQTLPTASASTMGKLYFVPSSDPKTANVKDEYITLAVTENDTTTYSWELIGSTTLDLTNYYTKTQTDAAITAALNTALASYSTTTQVGTLISTAINSALQAYATKEYVGQQVQEYAGTFRGTFDTLAELEETVGNHHNDYAWVKVTDSDGDNDYDRYKYNGSAWVFEYRLNNTHFTSDELAAIRSGMTTAKREKLDALPTSDTLTDKFNFITQRTRLTDFDLATLKQAVADQNLEKYGLKVGDYKTINGHDYVIAGLNVMKGTTTPYRLTANHVGLIVIPHTTQKWNVSGNTYTGADNRGAGYKNSDLHYYLVNTLLPLVQTDLGAANLLKHSKLLSNAVNQSGINRYGEATGCSSGWEWVADQYICALSEVQVYGATVWSSSGYDTGEACRQLDVFRHFNHTEIFGGEYPWLRDVVSASSAAHAYITGNASTNAASDARYVAALVLFN